MFSLKYKITGLQKFKYILEETKYILFFGNSYNSNIIKGMPFKYDKYYHKYEKKGKMNKLHIVTRYKFVHF